MARIVAIEPEPNNFALLRKNTSPYRNVTSINAAISNHRSRIDLSNARGSDATSAWETVESNSGPIEAITIRDALAQVPNATPFIAKIDIEGFETELFRSDYDWVGQFPLIVFEHHDWLFAWKGSAHAMFKALTEFGPRDYLQRGENIFSYSHALLRPSQA